MDGTDTGVSKMTHHLDPDGEYLIPPEGYTPEIIARIERIKYRMRSTLVEFTENDIKVFRHSNFIYILANPILGEEPIFDDMGRLIEMIPLYNLTIKLDKDWLKTERVESALKFTAKIPRLRVMRPDLCDRIEL